MIGEQSAAMSQRKATITQGRDTEKPLFLNLKLTPHRSLKRVHFEWLCLVLLVICGLASIRFWIIGAWPVVFFLMFDVFAIWFAFTLNYKRGQAFETIQLSETDLIIARSDTRGRISMWRFEPYWTKVTLEKTGDNTINRLMVHLHDDKVTLGSFLLPTERTRIAKDIDDALQHWRARSFT